MSITISNQTELNDPENQFNTGIKMIISAYETQMNLLSNEISSLSSEIQIKNAKIAEMEEVFASFLKQKEDYESTINLLSEKYDTINQQFAVVLEENKELKKIKETIIATIEKTSSSTNNNNHNHNDTTQNNKLYKSKSKTNIYNNRTTIDNFHSDVHNTKRYHRNSISNCNYELSRNNNNNNRNSNSNNTVVKMNKNHKYSHNKTLSCVNQFNKKECMCNININTNMNNTISNSNNNTCKHLTTTRTVNTSRNAYNKYIDFNYNSSNNNNNNKGNNTNNNNIVNLTDNTSSSLSNYSNKNTNTNNSTTTSTTDFFLICKSTLPPSTYNQIINIVQLFNNKHLSKEETYTQISSLLPQDPNSQLQDEFKKLFQ